MKLIRYRKPSMKTLLGVTKAKRRLKKATGISRVEAFTKPSRVKQKVKYELGLASPTARLIRQTSKGKFPSILGIFSGKKR